jgi:hypothetical protein
VCEQSQDLNANFVANNCGQAWCEMARGEHAAWLARNERSCATEATRKVNAVACKEVTNHLAAASRLNCNF